MAHEDIFLTKETFRIHPFEIKVSESVLDYVGVRNERGRLSRDDEPIPVISLSEISETTMKYVPTLDTILEKQMPNTSIPQYH